MPEPVDFFLKQAEDSQHIYFIYDLASQRVVFVNAAYERLLGGRCAQAQAELPALLARLHPDDQPVWQRYWQLWRRGQLLDEVEARLCAPGQPDQWLSLTPTHWLPAGAAAPWLGGVLRDVSDCKLRQATNAHLASKKNTVLEILAHDLAGAFGLLQQLTQHVQQELGAPANPGVSHTLALMQTTSQRGQRLLRDLMDQEFLETVAIPLRLERVDLGACLQECLAPYLRTPGQEALRLTLELPAAPLHAEVDVSKFSQIVSNLVSNALKFTPDGGAIRVRLAAHAGGVRLTVADQGIGIPAELQPVLFDKFTKARRPGLRGEPTTGLGLSLCKTIVELHRGTLAVRSTEGQGTTVTVLLPAGRV